VLPQAMDLASDMHTKTTETAPQSPKPVRYLKGVGPRKAEAFKRIGIENVSDLFYFFPRRYEDRSHFVKISDVKIGAFVTLQGKVVSAQLKPLKRLKLFEMWIQDDTGLFSAIWFNQPYLKRIIHENTHIIISGKAELYQNRLQMTQPEYEIIDIDEENPVHTGRITPIYPLTEGLFQRSLRVIMKSVVEHEMDKCVQDYLPASIQKRLHFMGLPTAVRQLHFPESFEMLEEARKRLIFDDFFLLGLRLMRKQQTVKRKKAIPFQYAADTLKEFTARLPFQLTKDQETVIREIAGDMSQPAPMTRLLQGEVGSGKTVVAAFMMALAKRNQCQSVFLIPTEVLAEQHMETMTKILKGTALKVALLTASITGEERVRVLEQLASGGIDVLVGTHAVLQETVQFKNLGLVVIDEQHKFGVKQRSQLLARVPRPHLLIMSATPIPRTLGLTVYGDFDISTIRELPKGRQPIKTVSISSVDESKLMTTIRAKVAQGEQAYIIFPMIEENQKNELQAAVQEYDRLKNGPLKSIPIGLVHGRLGYEDRERVMESFRKGLIKILIATTVVEVGVDNPNATVMVIKHAERFGLSQLHQIRGRIGRGVKPSVCYLVSDHQAEDALKRIKILTQSQDGFEIAEEDLKLRGPGEFLGVRQSGVPFFKIAHLSRDHEWLKIARQEAKNLLQTDPDLNASEHQRLKEMTG